jgi:hypothetical protein
MENVPVLSWLFLRGRCSGCHAPISPRYPLVEMTSSLLCAFAAFHFGYGWAASVRHAADLVPARADRYRSGYPVIAGLDHLALALDWLAVQSVSVPSSTCRRQ